VKVIWPKEATSTASLEFSLDCDKLHQVRRKEGRNLPHTHLTAHEPDALWRTYIQLASYCASMKTTQSRSCFL
jgi:hypothetical protein